MRMVPRLCRLDGQSGLLTGAMFASLLAPALLFPSMIISAGDTSVLSVTAPPCQVPLMSHPGLNCGVCEMSSPRSCIAGENRDEALDDGANCLRASGWSAACGEEFISRTND